MEQDERGDEGFEAWSKGFEAGGIGLLSESGVDSDQVICARFDLCSVIDCERARDELNARSRSRLCSFTSLLASDSVQVSFRSSSATQVSLVSVQSLCTVYFPPSSIFTPSPSTTRPTRSPPVQHRTSSDLPNHPTGATSQSYLLRLPAAYAKRTGRPTWGWEGECRGGRSAKGEEGQSRLSHDDLQRRCCILRLWDVRRQLRLGFLSHQQADSLDSPPNEGELGAGPNAPEAAS